MEPSLNPALERQAIGRVHRLGQTRPVEVVRLAMGDSVESRVMDYLEMKFGSSADRSSAMSDEDVKGGKDVKVGLVGNLSTERVNVMMGEFDLLFGVASLANEENSASSEVRVDQVMSSADL
jgi:hypothetical protein